MLANGLCDYEGGVRFRTATVDVTAFVLYLPPGGSADIAAFVGVAFRWIDTVPSVALRCAIPLAYGDVNASFGIATGGWGSQYVDVDRHEGASSPGVQHRTAELVRNRLLA